MRNVFSRMCEGAHDFVWDKVLDKKLSKILNYPIWWGTFCLPGEHSARRYTLDTEVKQLYHMIRLVSHRGLRVIILRSLCDNLDRIANALELMKVSWDTEKYEALKLDAASYVRGMVLSVSYHLEEQASDISRYISALAELKGTLTKEQAVEPSKNLGATGGASRVIRTESTKIGTMGDLIKAIERGDIFDIRESDPTEGSSGSTTE